MEHRDLVIRGVDTPVREGAHRRLVGVDQLACVLEAERSDDCGLLAIDEFDDHLPGTTVYLARLVRRIRRATITRGFIVVAAAPGHGEGSDGHGGQQESRLHVSSSDRRRG